MKYIIRLMSGGEFKVTEQERDALLKKTGLIYIASLDRAVNTSSITEIVSEDQDVGKVDRNRGVLHDGTDVVRKFGQWVVLGREEMVVDPAYYPEVAKDIVPSVQEFQEKYIGLPKSQVLKLLTEPHGKTLLEG